MPNGQPIRGVIWVGVSSDRQVDDKISMDAQLEMCKAYAEANGIEVIRVFWWDGESRWESDPVTALEEFAKIERFEYHELRRLWQQKAFDILICHNHSRLGRSFTMQSWVIENVIRSGAQIYRIQGGLISAADYAGQIALGGFSTVSEISRFVEMRKSAIRRRLERGLPQSKHIFSHRVIRDSRGKALKLIVDEDYRPLWNDFADLFLSGAGVQTIEKQLAERGHLRKSGKPHPASSLYRMLHNPMFWGHTFWNTKGHRKYHGAWAYDDTVEPDDGIVLFRHTHDPVYTGAQADAIKAELKRRHQLFGRAKAHGFYMFMALTVCSACGRNLAGSSDGHGWRGYRCGGASWDICQNKQHISEKVLKAWFDARLRVWLEAGEVAFPDPSEPANGSALRRIEQLESEAEELSRKIDVLILEQSIADADLRDIYRTNIRQLKDRYDIIVPQARQLRYQHESMLQKRANTNKTLEELRVLSVDKLWEKPAHEINQLLHRLLGDNRIVVDLTTKTVVGYTVAGPHQRKSRRAKSRPL